VASNAEKTQLNVAESSKRTFRTCFEQLKLSLSFTSPIAVLIPNNWVVIYKFYKHICKGPLSAKASFILYGHFNYQLIPL